METRTATYTIRYDIENGLWNKPSYRIIKSGLTRRAAEKEARDWAHTGHRIEVVRDEE